MSLEEQFEVQLRKHLDDTGHFAREASAKLLEKLNEDGVLATIKQYLGPIEGKVGNRFWRFGLTDPLSVRMLEIGRPDLTVFSFVLRPEWAELFTEDQRSWARRMLEKEQCASEEALWWLKSRKEQVDADCDDDELERVTRLRKEAQDLVDVIFDSRLRFAEPQAAHDQPDMFLLERALNDRLTKQLLKRVPKIVGRFAELSELTSAEAVPEDVQLYLEESTRCYLLGARLESGVWRFFFFCGIILCVYIRTERTPDA